MLLCKKYNLCVKSTVQNIDLIAQNSVAVAFENKQNSEDELLSEI